MISRKQLEEWCKNLPRKHRDIVFGRGRLEPPFTRENFIRLFINRGDLPPEASALLNEEVEKAEEVEKPKIGWGDKVSAALSTVGITEERVSEWIGAPCGCTARREKLNRLGQWAEGVTSGLVEGAKEKLMSWFG